MPGLGGLAAVLAALFVAGGGSARAAPGEPFFVGFSEDLPKEIGSAAVTPAAELGGSAFRLTTLWTPGRTVIPAAEATKLNRAVGAVAGQRIVLAVYAESGADAPDEHRQHPRQGGADEQALGEEDGEPEDRGGRQGENSLCCWIR